MTITHKHSPVIQEDGYYPFGMVASSSKLEARSWKSEAGRPLQNDFLYNGKELQEALGLDWYYFGNRIYDPVIAKWHSIDPVAESYFSYSSYNYVRNNPILRVDPNGSWDVTVHVFQNREKYGYGVAEVTDRHGNVVHIFTVRVEGAAGRNRMKRNADTPTGVYDIPDENMWLAPSDGAPGTKEGKKRASYGPNHRLILTLKSGEILDSGRDLIRIHGGRQEIYDQESKKWVPADKAFLKRTFGCIRSFDSDIKMLKDITDALSKVDSNETGGQLVVLDDIFEDRG